MRRIAHIIHPVTVHNSSDLNMAQPITFRTMRTAKEVVATQVDVVQFYAKYADETPPIPEGFQKTPDLDRSVVDVADFSSRRKLALIKDILDRLYEAAEADYLIYTNVDIALMPHFYTAVSQFIDEGYDAFIINRRTISKIYTKPQDITLMLAQAGEPHKGHDCFVFRREVYPDYQLGMACVGTAWVGKIMALNLIHHAKRFREFKDLHLTFHIGNDAAWRLPEFRDYRLHNERELKKVLEYYGVFQEPCDNPLVRRLAEAFGHNPVTRKLRLTRRHVVERARRVLGCSRLQSERPAVRRASSGRAGAPSSDSRLEQ